MIYFDDSKYLDEKIFQFPFKLEHLLTMSLPYNFSVLQFSKHYLRCDLELLNIYHQFYFLEPARLINPLTNF